MKNITIQRAITLCALYVMLSCGNHKPSEMQSEHNVYINHMTDVTASLSPERKQQRLKWLSDLKGNSVYVALTEKGIVSVEYLPALNAVSDGIRNTYIDNGQTAFGVSEDVAIPIEKSNSGKEKMDFIVAVTALSISENGGIPKEIVEVFERYKSHYNFYGNKGETVISSDDKQETIPQAYNLSYVFVLFDPSDEKALDAIYESIKNGISTWSAEDRNLVNGFMAVKSKYMDHLKKVYPKSEYLLNVDFDLTPEELYGNYRDNEVAADEKFKNKKLAVTGTITDIGKDITNRPYISFKVGFLESVTCYFSKEDISAIAKLSKGEAVTVVGECEGLVLKNVVVSDCKIWQ